jgi:hypothetical protein
LIGQKGNTFYNWTLEPWFLNFSGLGFANLWKQRNCQVPVAHTCNPSYSVGRDQEDLIWSQPRQILLETPSQKISNTKHKKGLTDGVAQMVKHQPSKYEALRSNTSTENTHTHTHTHTDISSWGGCCECCLVNGGKAQSCHVLYAPRKPFLHKHQTHHS